ncbi:hypothetical protein DIE19_01050 [Burkholderia sp. Bp9126]|nr:hypothetical protein DIE19_01050 [Burkholderia sp. Bp9126]
MHAHRVEIRRIVEANRASNARVFGAVLHGEDTDESDLDLLVDPQPGMTQLDVGHVELERHTLCSVRLLARTSADRWLVLEHRLAVESRYGMPTIPFGARRLIPARELAVAFAPRTNVRLGLRFSGPAAPSTLTSCLLSHAECQRLAAVAHHDNFFPPDQYGVVDPSDADWVEALAARALDKEVPVDVAAGRALT